MALIRDPIYQYFLKGFRGQPSIEIREKNMEIAILGVKG